MSSQFNFYKGDTWTGTIQARVAGIANPSTQTPYVFPASGMAQINFPGVGASVEVLSTNPLPSPLSGYEVAPATGTLTDFNFTVIPSKTALVAAGKNQSIDLILTDQYGNVTTVEIPKCLNVFTRANP
jgi:hypothetical protein